MNKSTTTNKNTNSKQVPVKTKEVNIKKTFQITKDVIEDCLSTCLG